MKALQFTHLGRLDLVDIACPTIGATDVLIRTAAGTICTSDLIDLRSNPTGIALPVILGHEAAGTVAAVGEAVDGIQVGDRVATHPVHHCGRCTACTGGTPHLCLHMRHFGLNMQGTFAEYFVARADRVRAVPPDTDLVSAALTEPLCVCLEALQQARLTSGQTLLIIGDGPFGLIMARLAATRDLCTVVLAGQHDFRLAFAGMVHTINVTNVHDPHDALMRATNEVGYDAVILAVGNQEAAAVALGVLKPRGRLVLFAAIHGATPVDLAAVHRKELEIIGSCNDLNLLDEAVDMLGDQALGLAQLVTHRFPIDAYQQAFTLAETGQDQAVKVAIVF
jgi:L-iditol 2-dehydrogenase